LNVHEIVRILPTQIDAAVLLTYYIKNLNWAHHIIHAPTVYGYMETIYKKLSISEPPCYPQLALIATILAVAAFHWSGSIPLALMAERPKACCKKWVLLTQRALNDSHHITSPTIETIQSLILLSQYMPTFPQIANRSASQALLVNAAHFLQLHRVDSSSMRSFRAVSGCDMVELELKRRAWWNIVSTDWYDQMILKRREDTKQV
jgi:hypothetical protein